MIYTENDIDFSQLSPKEFENLCYELIVSYGFQSVTWRQGGPDSGRDIEASLPFVSTFTVNHSTKWFFECKHYSNGIPPQDLVSKIAWADAEMPDFLVILTTAYLSNGAKIWIEKIQFQKAYKIIVIEGVELKRRLTSVQNLIPKYFSGDKYMKLFQEIRRQSSIYNIHPSFEVLEAIIENIPIEKLDLNDVGFLLHSFYSGFDAMEIACEYSGNFNPSLAKPLFERLKKISPQMEISKCLVDTQCLAGSGFLDDAEMQEETNKVFQNNLYQLNMSNPKKSELGSYLLVVVDKKYAIEIFTFDSKNYETVCYVYNNYNESLLKKIISKFNSSDDYFDNVKLFCRGIL